MDEILGFLCAGSVVGLAVLWGIVRIVSVVKAAGAVRARPDQLRAMAPTLGLREETVPEDWSERELAHSLLAEAFGGASTAVLRGSRDGVEERLFDLAYERGHRATRQVHMLTVVEFRAPEGRWPELLLRPVSEAWDPVEDDESFQGFRKVSLGQAFDAEFTLFARDEAAARDPFDVATVQALLAATEAKPTVECFECFGPRLLFYVTGTLAAPEHLPGFLQRARGLERALARGGKTPPAAAERARSAGP